jgi:hypothetical protein
LCRRVSCWASKEKKELTNKLLWAGMKLVEQLFEEEHGRRQVLHGEVPLAIVLCCLFVRAERASENRASERGKNGTRQLGVQLRRGVRW